MAVQYWVGGFFVDLSRNQITQNGHVQTIAPKALAVLTYLARNQGKVVSHGALLSNVWGNTIVSPNTLQRCVAQLRKALGDEGKAYIETHAKQGYSLECDVRWHVEDAHPIGSRQVSIASNSAGRNSGQSTPRRTTTIAVVALGTIVAAILAYQKFSPELPTRLAFDHVQLLTATDDKEFDASYSPNGRYIVFHRYLDKQCVNRIWAKDVTTQQEILLTKDWGAYGSHSFSQDGKRLAFLATEACSEPATQINCYDLVTLDFEEALVSPQQPSLVLECRNSDINKPIWIGNDNIALKQRTSDQWRLINYSISDHDSAVLYDPDDGNLVDYTYSPNHELIAVISIKDDDNHYIDMLDSAGQALSSHPIARPDEIPQHQLIFPSFHPTRRQLVFSTGRQLFTLSFDGNVGKIDLPLADKIGLPVFHPNGQKMLAIKGPYDSDIVLLSRNEVSDTAAASQPPPLTSYRPFERSTMGEDNAMFQPGGDLIAFVSDRSGDDQLWVSDGNGAYPLTDFPVDTSIRGVDWAADGSRLLVNANDQLTEVFLDASQQAIVLDHPVAVLLQWDSHGDRAILLARIRGILTLVEADLKTAKLTALTDEPVLWAQESSDGRLIYKDTRGQYWKPGPAEAQRIEALDQQRGKAKSFVLNDNTLFAINKQNQLWSYHLDSEVFEVLGEVDERVDYLTDINQSQLLMTIEVAAKKEVVEISSSETSRTR